MSETKISGKIREMIKKEFPEIQFTRLQAGLIFARHGAKIHCADPGWFDYVGYLPDGRFLGIEIKDPDGTTKKERAQLQKARRDSVNSAGGVALQLESVEQARRCIKEAIKCI